MIIEEEKISMDSGKLQGIKEWPIPTTVKQIRGFLGFGNFYQRFIKHFSEIAKPLNDLLKKDRKFEWTDDCQKSFEELKKRFMEEPVLVMPDQSRPFQIECDASKHLARYLQARNCDPGHTVEVTWEAICRCACQE
jgi:hypothetical protein